MSYLLSFNPNKPLDFKDKISLKSEAEPTGRVATEKELFEALWIGYKGGDLPKFGQEVKSSIRIETMLMEKSIEGGSIKLVMCGACGQRMMRHGELRTIEAPVDWIIEKADFEYLKGCLGKWERTFAELKQYFAELDTRFEAMEEKSAEHWRKILADREAKVTE